MQSSTQALQRAAVLWQQGRQNAAIQAFEQVLAQEPDNFLALNNLAAIRVKCGQLAEAEQLYLRAGKKHPNRNEPFLALATLYGQYNRIEDAIRQLRHAVRNTPNHPLVLYLMGKHLLQQRAYEEAIDYLRRSVAQKVENPEQVMTLAQAYSEANRMEEACAIYEQILAQQPGNVAAIKALAECRFVMGEKAAAIQVYEQALRHYPDELGIYYSLSYLTEAHLDDALEKKIARVLDDKKSPQGQRAFAQFLKARYARRAKHYDEEMHWLLEAHQNFIASHPLRISTDDYMAMFESYAQNPPFHLSEALSPCNDERSPIFIIGTPRSGSTLLENIVCAADSTLIKGEETSVISRQIFRMQDHPAEARSMQLLREKALNEYRNMGMLEAPRFTDKSLENCFCIDVILSLFPQAKVIYSKRALLASMVSILQNNLPALPWAHSLEGIKRYFEASHRAMQHFLARYPNNILVVEYESLVSDPEHHAREILKFCDIPWTDDCLAFHKQKKVLSKTASTDQIRSPINTRAVDRFKNYRTFFEEKGLLFNEKGE